MKKNTFTHNPHNFRTAQKSHKNVITEKTRGTLRKGAKNLLKKVNKSIDVNCGLFEHLS